MENMISKALRHDEIICEDSPAIINEEIKYCEL